MARRNDNGSGIFYDKNRDRWVATIQCTDKKGKAQKKFTGKKKSAEKNKLNEFKLQLNVSSGNISNDYTLFKDYATAWMNNIQKNKSIQSALMNCSLIFTIPEIRTY